MNLENYQTILSLQEGLIKKYYNQVDASEINRLLIDVFRSISIRSKKQRIDNIEAYTKIAIKHRIENYIKDRRKEAKQIESIPLVRVEQPTFDVDMDNSIQEKRNQTIIKEALNILNQKQKQVIRLYLMEGLSAKKVAEITGIPTNQIPKIKKRAVERLRQIYKPIKNESKKRKSKSRVPRRAKGST